MVGLYFYCFGHIQLMDLRFLRWSMEQVENSTLHLHHRFPPLLTLFHNPWSYLPAYKGVDIMDRCNYGENVCPWNWAFPIHLLLGIERFQIFQPSSMWSVFIQRSWIQMLFMSTPKNHYTHFVCGRDVLPNRFLTTVWHYINDMDRHA